MLASLTAKLRRGPRRPLVGVALAAVAGILCAEAWRVCGSADENGAAVAPWVGSGIFLFCVTGWSWRRRAGWFWAAVAAGYGALHLFGTNPVGAAVLARALASPANAIATGHDPTNGTAHVLHGVGAVLDLPRLIPPPPMEPPGRPAGSATWRFVLRLESVAVEGMSWPCHADVAATWRDGPRAVSPGDRLAITALAENLAPPRNPGEFDQAARWRRQGILSAVRLAGVADGRILPPADGVMGWGVSRSPLRRLAGHAHGWMERTLSLDLTDDPEATAIVSTALLGLSNPPGLGELENVFQRTGTLHYFAVDGLKLGLVAFLLLRVLAAVGVQRPWTGVLVLPVLLGYALATGLGAASARAVIVAAVVVVGEFVDRPILPSNSLGAAAAAVLFFNTQQLFELGFQLTFSVMLAILALVGPLTQRLQRLGAPDPFVPPSLFSTGFRAWEWLRRRAWELVAVSVAAWIGSLPLMLLVFHLFSPVSLVANVVTFPLAFAVLAVGVFSLAGGLISQALAVWFNNANWLLAKMFLGTARCFDALPGGSFAVPAPSHWHRPAPAAELVVFDFDRGRAASLRAGRAEWLLDAARLSEYGTGVLPCLRAGAVARLTGGLLLTQGDADYLAAARLAFTDLHPARVVESALPNRSPLLRDFRRFLAGQRFAETFCRRGEVIPLGGGAHATVLYPPDDLSGKFRTAADRALVLQIEAAGWRILLLTEGNGAAANWLAVHAPPDALASQVLITAGPVSLELLAAVRPSLVVLRPPIVKESTGGKTAPIAVPPPLPPTIPVLMQRDCGAVTMLVYPDHLAATGFVDNRKVTLRK